MVIPIPDSGVPAAIGYAEESGIPFQLGLIRNHYVGRTFIEPQQSIRHFGVKIKLNPVREVIEGKRVVVVDDSIVRGTTARKIIKMIRNAGAREVHMRISSPPTSFPCYYGIDTPTRKELISSSHTGRGDQPLHHRRYPRLPQPRGDARRRRRPGGKRRPFLRCLLQRPVPGQVPAPQGGQPAGAVSKAVLSYGCWVLSSSQIFDVKSLRH